MKRNFFIILIAALLLAPWPIVYAYEGVNADTTTSVIQSADPAAAPQIKAYGNAVGSVTPGDLFIVDMTGNQGDTNYELIIANVNDLVHDYRFLNLKIGIYVQGKDDAHWDRLTATNGEQLHDIYITMVGGTVSFTLPGGAKYKIVIDTGCFYAYGRNGTGAATPQFYLSAS